LHIQREQWLAVFARGGFAIRRSDCDHAYPVPTPLDYKSSGSDLSWIANPTKALSAGAVPAQKYSADYTIPTGENCAFHPLKKRNFHPSAV
jgi:hypothetical protein